MSAYILKRDDLLFLSNVSSSVHPNVWLRWCDCHSGCNSGACYLFQEYVSQLVNGEIMPRSRLQAVVATKEELIQKVGVNPGQLIKAWEQSMDNTGIQLELIQHALTEDPLHYVQGLHVTRLCLNQLCK